MRMLLGYIYLYLSLLLGDVSVLRSGTSTKPGTCSVNISSASMNQVKQGWSDRHCLMF